MNGSRLVARGGAGLGAPVVLVALVLFAIGVARADEVTVTLADASGGGCAAHGTFLAPVTPELAWGVLSDYDAIPQFIRSMHASHVERAEDGRLLVRQDAVVTVFMVKRHMKVLLDVEEEPIRRIGFRDTLGEDFRSYVGEWRITPTPNQTRIDYQLAAEPRSAIGRALCRGAMRRSAQDLLEQVRAEMIRRAGESEAHRDSTAAPPSPR